VGSEIQRHRFDEVSQKLSPRTARLQARRAVLRMRLGGKCVQCPNVVGLEFDCVEPRGHWHHVTGSSQRQSFYEAEAEAGNLQLLCRHHHQEKTNAEARARRGLPTLETVPVSLSPAQQRGTEPKDSLTSSCL
jgi:hypothetical protein